VRVIVLAAVVILVGCGTDERDRPEPPAASTRAAGTDFLQRCAREAASATVAVLCPTRLPIGGFERPRNYGVAPCTYLLNLEPRGFRKRAGTVFHLLFGATCRPWNLQTRGGRWSARLTAARAGEDLRLIEDASLLAGQSEADRKRVALRVLRHARVGAAPALVLRNPPYPTGGIHGGHISVVWNANGAGYVVTGHAVATPERPDATPGARALRRASDTLLAVAAAMRRPPA
jgi:hypothetical protein